MDAGRYVGSCFSNYRGSLYGTPSSLSEPVSRQAIAIIIHQQDHRIEPYFCNQAIYYLNRAPPL